MTERTQARGHRRCPVCRLRVFNLAMAALLVALLIPLFL